MAVKAVPECPVSTSDGVKAIDDAGLSTTRPEHIQKPIVLEQAPEILVEIISPSNTVAEIKEKKALYFEAGHRKSGSAVWTAT